MKAWWRRETKGQRDEALMDADDASLDRVVGGLERAESREQSSKRASASTCT